MKKTLLISLVSVLLSSSLFAQSPVVQQIINAVNLDSLIFSVRELSGDIPTTINGQPYTIVSRHKLQPGNDKAADYIKQRLQYYGLTVADQNWSSTGRNVIGKQLGTEYPNQHFIICAHYDDMPSGTTAPGADDNASGTAAVLEAARILSQHSFPYSIYYALWDEEEQGLVGSDYYSDQAFAAGDSILGVINLDMIAWDSNSDNVADIHTRSTGNSIQLKDEMLDINSVYNIGLTFVIRNPGSTYSDHASFWTNGYGAILLIENDSDFNAYYHTTNDKIQFFNQPYFAKMSRVSIGAIAKLALNLNLAIQHSPIASNSNTSDIITSATINTGLDIGTGGLAPRLYYRINTGSGYSSFYEVVGSVTESATYSFTIPGQQLGTSVQYYIAAQDVNSSISATLPQGGGGFNPPGSTPPTQFITFLIAPINYLFVDNAANISNWASVSGWNTTTNKFKSAPSSFTESPSGNYPSNLTATLTLNQPVNIPNAMSVFLEFWTQWDIEDNWDYGQILISTNGGTSWNPLSGSYTNPGTGTFQPTGQPLYDGIQSSWVKEEINLSSFMGQQILLRYLLKSDGSVQKDGWYVDDISIVVYDFIPVELVSFTAEASNNSVNLRWITATETNNNGFDVERAQQDKVGDLVWNKIGFIQGKGTTTSISNYSYNDENLNAGKYSYRLKQIDYDGTYYHSKEINVDVLGITSYALEQNYPNPFNPTTVIKYQIPSAGNVQIKIYDILGNLTANLVSEAKDAGRYEIKFDASRLSSGTYFYTIIANGFVQTKKMLLVK